MSDFRLKNVYYSKKCVKLKYTLKKKLDNITSVKTFEILKYNLNILGILRPNTLYT